PTNRTSAIPIISNEITDLPLLFLLNTTLRKDQIY
ncbi:MAG: hypothetical protein ACI9O5_001804, partial [Algoriphagus sp.]